MEKHRVAHLVNLKTALILQALGQEVIVSDGKYLTIRKEEGHEHNDTPAICKRLQV